MARLSLPLLLSSLFAIRSVAQNPIPLGNISPNAAGACPCYVIADVRGILFGTETVTQTDVVIASTALGKNGSVITATTIFAPDQPFTLAPTGLITAAPAQATVFNYNNGTVTFAGLTLSGPSAYDIFTAYTYVTGTPDSSGNCIMSTTATPVSPAFSVVVPLSGDAGAAAIAAESSFALSIGLPTCTNAGANFGQQTQVPATVVTVTSATAGPAFVPSLTAETLGGVTVTSTVPPSSPTSTSSSTPSSSSLPSTSIPSISPTTTITVQSTSTKTVVTNTATDKTTVSVSTTTVIPTVVETYLPPGYGQTSTVKYSGAVPAAQSQLMAWMASLGSIALGFFAL